jgi:zinc protease
LHFVLGMKKRLCILAALLPALPAAAVPGRTRTPEPQELKATLKNGLQVVIVRDPLAPAAAVVLNYRVGSDEAPAGFPGMAHAQEHMMFRGSPGLSANQLAAAGADMGGMFDADTQQSVTQYTFTTPADDLNTVLRIEAIRMRGVLDSEALWQQERGAIEQEVQRDLSDPEYVSYERLLGVLFRGTPYAHGPLGTIPSFNSTTGRMLQRFHRTWYAPNNAVLVITGDVQPSAVLAEVERAFAEVPSRPLPSRPAFQFQPVEPETIRLQTDRPYGLALIAFRTAGFDSPDYAAADVMARVLNSPRGALHALAAEGKDLQAGFSLQPLPKAGIGLAFAAFPAGMDGDKEAAQVRAILAAGLTKGFPEDLVKAARQQALAAAEFRKTSIGGLAEDWAQAVAVEGRNSPEDDVRAIERVTTADVDRVARKYLDPKHAVIAILTPQPSGKAPSSAAPGGPESFLPSHVKPVVLPQWAQGVTSHLAVPRSELHPVVSTLPNGIRLIVQPETVSDTISVFGHIRNNADLETLPGKEGVSDTLEGMFEYGTQTLGRMAFQKALDDIGARESGGTDFSLQVLRAQFEPGMRLLADNELHPALAEANLSLVRGHVAGAVAGRLRSPGYIASRRLDAGLFPKGDPTLRQPTPASVSALTLDDVADYYHLAYRPDLTTIVAIGNVTPQAVRAAVEKYFGAWKASGPQPPTFLPSVPPNERGYAAVPDAARVQDKVIMAEALGLNRFNPGYYALNLGNHILGGGFYATRLYRDLRETSGLVYTVSSDLNVGHSRGVYAVAFGCNPENVFRAAAIVRRDLEEMRARPASVAELLQAKTLLLHQIPLAEASEDQIAAGFLARSDIGLPLDEPTIAARHYLTLTAAQVRAAFAQWIRPHALVQVVQGPSPR